MLDNFVECLSANDIKRFGFFDKNDSTILSNYAKKPNPMPNPQKYEKH
jgi:hypothetical protein